MNDKNAGKKLAEEHWRNYIEELVEAHEKDKSVIPIVKFHYISAFTHGYKHGQEAKYESSN